MASRRRCRRGGEDVVAVTQGCGQAKMQAVIIRYAVGPSSQSGPAVGREGRLRWVRRCCLASRAVKNYLLYGGKDRLRETFWHGCLNRGWSLEVGWGPEAALLPGAVGGPCTASSEPLCYFVPASPNRCSCARRRSFRCCQSRRKRPIELSARLLSRHNASHKVHGVSANLSN